MDAGRRDGSGAAKGYRLTARTALRSVSLIMSTV